MQHRLICVAAALLVAGGARPAPPLTHADLPLRTACARAHNTYPLRRARLEVRKSERRLRLWSGKTLVKEYPIALGFCPVGTKERQGDGRTPEGRYYLCYRNGVSRFHRFIGLSYPAPADADRAVKRGLVDRRVAASVRLAARRKGPPPWDTALGGAVGIHGGGTGRDWTWGCIGLEDRDIDELWEALPLGTPVDIRP